MSLNSSTTSVTSRAVNVNASWTRGFNLGFVWSLCCSIFSCCLLLLFCVYYSVLYVFFPFCPFSFERRIVIRLLITPFGIFKDKVSFGNIYLRLKHLQPLWKMFLDRWHLDCTYFIFGFRLFIKDKWVSSEFVYSLHILN